MVVVLFKQGSHSLMDPMTKLKYILHLYFHFNDDLRWYKEYILEDLNNYLI